MTISAQKTINRFRKAYPEFSDYSNYEIKRLLDSDKKAKRLVDVRLKKKIGEIELKRMR